MNETNPQTRNEGRSLKTKITAGLAGVALVGAGAFALLRPGEKVEPTPRPTGIEQSETPEPAPIVIDPAPEHMGDNVGEGNDDEGITVRKTSEPEPLTKTKSTSDPTVTPQEQDRGDNPDNSNTGDSVTIRK